MTPRTSHPLAGYRKGRQRWLLEGRTGLTTERPDSVDYRKAGQGFCPRGSRCLGRPVRRWCVGRSSRRYTRNGPSLPRPTCSFGCTCCRCRVRGAMPGLVRPRTPEAWVPVDSRSLRAARPIRCRRWSRGSTRRCPCLGIMGRMQTAGPAARKAVHQVPAKCGVTTGRNFRRPRHSGTCLCPRARGFPSRVWLVRLGRIVVDPRSLKRTRGQGGFDGEARALDAAGVIDPRGVSCLRLRALGAGPESFVTIRPRIPCRTLTSIVMRC